MRSVKGRKKRKMNEATQKKSNHVMYTTTINSKFSFILIRRIRICSIETICIEFYSLSLLLNICRILESDFAQFWGFALDVEFVDGIDGICVV